MGLIDKVDVVVNGAQDSSKALVEYNTVILKQNIRESRNMLTQQMMSQRNTKYVIKWAYTLAEDIVLPNGCLIEFDGGSIKNDKGNSYTLTGNDTILIYSQEFEDVVKSVALEGTFIHKNCMVADEEDLTVEHSDLLGIDVLKFKDKKYNPLTYNGIGRVILRKNKVSGVNTLTQSMINQANTIYIIQYDFILGEDITVPENCILEFDGGSINNSGLYSITGNNTIINNASNKAIFDFLTLGIAGTWNISEIHSIWFKDLSFDNALKDVIALSNENIFNRIIIYKQSYDYIVSFVTEDIWEWALRLNSNTDLILNGILRVRGNGKTGYRTIFGIGVYNINISGSGEIIGDYYDNNEEVPSTGKHDFTAEGTHEYCHGITVYDSINVKIDGLKISRFPGDAIILSNTKGDIINKHNVNNCELYKCRRQGISIIGHQIILQNNYFHDIAGTNPQSAVDIEPNNNEQTCSGIIINNNIVENCNDGFVIDGHNGSVKNVIISNNNVSADNHVIFCNGSYVENICITNNNLLNTSILSTPSGCIYFYNTSKHVIVSNNKIVGKSFGIAFSNLAKKCYNIRVENNIIRSKDWSYIKCDNIIFENNEIALEATSSDKIYDFVDAINVSIKNNKFINSWIEGSMSTAFIEGNIFSFVTVAEKLNTLTLNNFKINNNIYNITAGEGNHTSAIRLHNCLMGEIKNITFNLPSERKVSNVVWFTGSSTKIECKNLRFEGEGNLAYSCILVSNTEEISVEGVYTNFRNNDTIPDTPKDGDIQRTGVVYVDASKYRTVISNGTNQYDALGNSLNSVYKLNKTGTFANKPTTGLYEGFEYFATDKGVAGVGAMIYYTGNSTTPWVYADGTAVS